MSKHIVIENDDKFGTAQATEWPSLREAEKYRDALDETFGEVEGFTIIIAEVQEPLTDGELYAIKTSKKATSVPV